MNCNFIIDQSDHHLLQSLIHSTSKTFRDTISLLFFFYEIFLTFLLTLSPLCLLTFCFLNIYSWPKVASAQSYIHFLKSQPIILGPFPPIKSQSKLQSDFEGTLCLMSLKMLIFHNGLFHWQQRIEHRSESSYRIFKLCPLYNKSLTCFL